MILNLFHIYLICDSYMLIFTQYSYQVIHNLSNKFRNSTGTYFVSIRVSNKFGFAETHLCPEIVVVDDTIREPSCDQLSVSLTNSSSEVNPLVSMRSAEIILVTQVDMQCTAADGETLHPRYSY